MFLTNQEQRAVGICRRRERVVQPSIVYIGILPRAIDTTEKWRTDGDEGGGEGEGESILHPA